MLFIVLIIAITIESAVHIFAHHCSRKLLFCELCNFIMLRGNCHRMEAYAWIILFKLNNGLYCIMILFLLVPHKNFQIPPFEGFSSLMKKGKPEGHKSIDGILVEAF